MRAKRILAEEVALVTAFALVLIGIGATNFAPQQSYRYWLWLTGLVAVSGTFIGFLHANRTEPDLHALFRLLGAQLVHWVAVFVSVFCVYLLLRVGRLNYENTGLVMALLLGLATFLDGFHRVGWRFALLGILMVVTAVTAGYIEAFVWPLLFLVILIWLLAFSWEHYRRHRDRLMR